MSEKITTLHLERAAYVYVRQSTSHQVLEHRESQRLQYQLKDRAQSLGFTNVIVIDDDLGVTATGTREQRGFARLLEALCQGRVGAVFAYEASRLSRNLWDWQHLLELCSLTGALVIDHRGVYDPRLLDDRALLGLQGTLSELEVGMMRQRAQAALKQIIRRGEVVTQLPVGFIWTERCCEKHPDRQVQTAIEGLFMKFEDLGTARQVLLWYHQEKIPFPKAEPGSKGHRVTWRLPTKSHVLSILKNPTYAGAFVYGRRQTRTRVVDGRARKTTGHMVSQEDWEVLIQDHHDGYVTWSQFMRNQRQLANNVQRREATGAAKQGGAVLVGLLRCARCWQKLKVNYRSRHRPRYYCQRQEPYEGTDKCITCSAEKVDEAVVGEVLKAVQPAGVQASLNVLDSLSEKESETCRQVRLAIEKARYETERARRQYDVVEPENRLVTEELERRWNAALTQQKNLEDRLVELEAAEQIEISPEDRQRLMEMGRDLESVWSHPEAPVEIKKRILRTVLDEIVIDIDNESRQVILQLHWKGGVHTSLKVRKNRSGEHGRTTSREAVDLIRELAQMSSDQQIAGVLNRLGLRTGAGQTWTKSRVRHARDRRKIPVFDESQDRFWLTLEETALELEVSSDTVRRLLREKRLPGRQIVRYAPWRIERAALELPEVRTAIQALKSQGRLPRRRSAEDEFPLFPTT